MSRFDRCLRHVLRWEGGLGDHAADPGGITNLGISLRFLEANRLDIDGDGDVDADDVRSLDLARAGSIYHAVIWDGVYDQLSDERGACSVFDMDVNMGERRAHPIAQRATAYLGEPVLMDGKAIVLIPYALVSARLFR